MQIHRTGRKDPINLGNRWEDLADHLDFALKKLYRKAPNGSYHNHCNEATRDFGAILATLAFDESSGRSLLRAFRCAEYFDLRSRGPFKHPFTRLGNFHSIGLLHLPSHHRGGLALAFDLVYDVIDNKSPYRTAIFQSQDEASLLEGLNAHYIANNLQNRWKKEAVLDKSKLERHCQDPKYSLFRTLV